MKSFDDISHLRKLLFSFSGTISRMEYWWCFIAPYSLLFSFLILFNVDMGDNSLWVSIILPFVLLYVWSSLAVSIKRFRDTGVDLKWLWFSLVPIVGQVWLLYCLLFKASINKNHQYSGSHDNVLSLLLAVSGGSLKGMKSIFVPTGITVAFIVLSIVFFLVDLPVERVCQKSFDSLYFGYGRAECELSWTAWPQIASNFLYAILSCFVIPVLFAHVYRIKKDTVRLFVVCVFGVGVSSQIFDLLYMIESAHDYTVRESYQGELFNLAYLISLACVTHVLLLIFGGRSLVSFIALYIIVLSAYHLSHAILFYAQEYNNIDVPVYYKDFNFALNFFLFHGKILVLPVNGIFIGSILWWSYILSKYGLRLRDSGFNQILQRVTFKKQPS